MDPIFQNKKAVLIDMDGVLYDSMPAHASAWHRLMTELGVACEPHEFYVCEGMTGKDTINKFMFRQFGHGVTDERAKELYAVKSKYFLAQGLADPMPHADRMVNALREAGLKRVLVTGSGQLSLLDRLEQNYPGIFLPGMRVTAHDVTHGKPSPEPYLKGAALAGADPSECVVIENAPLGVRAGIAAGARVIAVTTGPIPRQAFEAEGADMVFPSMEQLADWLETSLK